MSAIRDFMAAFDRGELSFDDTVRAMKLRRAEKELARALASLPPELRRRD